LSRLVAEPVPSRSPATLLADAGLHGHKYAIGAMLGVTTLTAPRPVTILTSGPEDRNATVPCVSTRFR
jgi:hypothetical protein